MYGVNDAAAAAASITHAEPVPATCIGAVVGSKGSGLRHLRETSGCAVEVPREEDAYGNRHVKLTGAPDRVQLGVALLQETPGPPPLQRTLPASASPSFACSTASAHLRTHLRATAPPPAHPGLAAHSALRT